MQATVAFWGAHGYAPSEAAVPFDVSKPVGVYRLEPAGLQAPWARSYLIPLPFVGVWLTYLLVLRLAAHMRRIGGLAQPPERAATS